jgi:hypothetical protein
MADYFIAGGINIALRFYREGVKWDTVWDIVKC